MEVLWISAQDPDFHVYYCEGPRQVTVLIFFTPRPGAHRPAAQSQREHLGCEAP